MRNLVDQLIRIPKHLFRNPSDEAKSDDQTLHLVLLNHLHPKLIPEAVVKFVGASSSSHDLDPFLHRLDGNFVSNGRLGDQGLNEPDTFVDLRGFESSKVQKTSG